MKKIGIIYIALVILLNGQEVENKLRFLFSLNSGIEYYSYTEPGVMNISGPMFVANADFGILYRFFKTQLEVYGGKDIGSSLYHGGIYDLKTKQIEPYDAQSTDYYLGTVLKLGFSLFRNHYEPIYVYSGIGYRFLHNFIIDKPHVKAAYTRDQGYIYLPIGINGEWAFHPKISVLGGFEYRILLYGHQASGLQALGFSSDAHFKQTDGMGFRVTSGMKFYLNKNHALKLTFYYDSWIIAKSDIVVLEKDGKRESFIEPANNTQTGGVLIGYSF